jgi:hypothetical protein
MYVCMYMRSYIGVERRWVNALGFSQTLNLQQTYKWSTAHNSSIHKAKNICIIIIHVHTPYILVHVLGLT